MKTELRISIKHYRRNKNLEVLLIRPPYPGRRFWFRMNEQRWPAGKREVPVARMMRAVRKALGRALGAGGREECTERIGRAGAGRATFGSSSGAGIELGWQVDTGRSCRTTTRRVAGHGWRDWLGGIILEAGL